MNGCVITSSVLVVVTLSASRGFTAPMYTVTRLGVDLRLASRRFLECSYRVLAAKIPRKRARSAVVLVAHYTHPTRRMTESLTRPPGRHLIDTAQRNYPDIPPPSARAVGVEAQPPRQSPGWPPWRPPAASASGSMIVGKSGSDGADWRQPHARASPRLQKTSRLKELERFKCHS
jgi:hypothetical protein